MLLFDVCVCSRVIKTDLEMAVLRYANKISSDAHKKASDDDMMVQCLDYLNVKGYLNPEKYMI